MKNGMPEGLKKVVKARLIGAGLSVALMLMTGVVAPSMAQDSLDKDYALIQACGSDVWNLCSGVLPDVLKVKTLCGEQDGPAFERLRRRAARHDGGHSFKICKNQTYALCAAARCNVYDGVAYCQCDVKHGDSISLPFAGKDRDVCSVNAAGADNKYMISTYSLPESIASPKGDRAVYTCSGDGCRRLRSVRRRNLLPKHREYDVPGARQPRAEGANRLFVPYH